MRNNLPTPHKWRPLEICLLATVLLTIPVLTSACDSDDSSNDGSGPSNRDAGIIEVDGGIGTDGGPTPDAGGVPDPALFVAVQRIPTPDNRIVAIHVLDSLDGQDLDLGTALELSGFARVYTFNEKIFTFDSETLEVSRYGLDDDLNPVFEDRFSMGNLGLQNFQSTAIFLARDRAVYIAPFEELVVVFDPDVMEIVSTYEIPGFLREGLIPRSNVPSRAGDRLYMAVAHWDPMSQGFSPTIDVLILSGDGMDFVGIAEDSRCVFSDNGFISGGDYYVVGNNFSGFLDLLNPGDLPAPCLLRIANGAGGFDEEFYVDLEASTGSRLVGGLSSATQAGRFIQQIYAGTDDPSTFEDPSELFSGELWRWTVGSLETGQVQVVPDLPLTTRNNFPINLIDDIPYLVISAGFEQSTLYRVDPVNLSAQAVLRSSAVRSSASSACGRGRHTGGAGLLVPP